MRMSIFQYYGGKYQLSKKIVELMPTHKVYVEVFGGAGNVLMRKEPEGLEVYNDINKYIVNLFRVIRDKEKFEEFYRQVNLIPYSREEFYYFRDEEDNMKTDIDMAVATYVRFRQSFSGAGTSWGFTRHYSKCMNWTKYLSNVELLPEITNRLKMVQIENQDFRKLIECYDSEDTLFYMDPPYVHSTRRKTEGYEHELEDSDHIDMLNIANKCLGKVMISGYNSSLYEEYLGNWKKYEYDVTSVCANNKMNKNRDNKRTEVIWIKDNSLSFI